jgi:hypothetical protein
MFQAYKAILKQLLVEWNRRTVSASMSIYYMLVLHIIIIDWEHMTTLHSRHFHIVASMLFPLCVALASWACSVTTQKTV